MDTNTITLLAGIVLPLIVDLAKRFLKLEGALATRLVAGGLSLAIALFAEASTKPIMNWQDLFARFSVIFGASQVVYLALLKDTEVSKVLAGK